MEVSEANPREHPTLIQPYSSRKGDFLRLPEGKRGKRKRRPRAAFGFAVLKLAYLAWPTIQVTAALTCASVRAGLPPFGGMKLPSGPW